MHVRRLTALLTGIALVAFASNSILCRLALRYSTIDAATFSTVRLLSGAATLLAIMAFSRRGIARPPGSWLSSGMLFLYAIPFSFAYTLLSAGTGALILFGCVQLTMMIAALSSGERPHPLQWLGLTIALAGLVFLVLPGLEAPSFAGAALMALAGFSWGIYSLRGRRAADPLAETTGNFVRAVPLALVVSAIAFGRFHAERVGLLAAVASGALASGLGYVVWYAALRGLTATRAAVVQLLVPILAALGGVAFLAEVITMRLVAASIMVLGGIALTLVGRERLAHKAVRSAA